MIPNEERCDFTWLIGYSCAHCLGHELPSDLTNDDD